MRCTPLALPGVLLLERAVHADRRGFLTEVFQAPRYADLGLDLRFVQDNHARSVQGTIRGLHWQRTQPQGKLLIVIRGAIVDVVADVRPGSPTYGQHVAVPLDDARGAQLWVPPGYAHGFCVTSSVADVLYKNTAPYVPGDGRGVRWDCATLGIAWPVDRPILSDADAALPDLAHLDPSDGPGPPP